MTLSQKLLYADKKLWPIYAIVFLPIMILGILEFSYSLAPLGLAWAFKILFGSLVLGVLARVIESRTKTKINRWLFLTSSLSLLAIIAFFLIRSQQSDINKERADKIILALKNYRAEHGEYPEELQQLTNGYLEEVPPTAFGILRQDFGYIREYPKDYELSYYGYVGIRCWYTPRARDWYCDD